MLVLLEILLVIRLTLTLKVLPPPVLLLGPAARGRDPSRVRLLIGASAGGRLRPEIFPGIIFAAAIILAAASVRAFVLVFAAAREADGAPGRHDRTPQERRPLVKPIDILVS